jgi:hypothetical protein
MQVKLPLERIVSGPGLRMRRGVGALLLLGLVVSSYADEWEEDDEVVVEEDVPEPVDPAAEARANHARMHGAPPWANDPEVLVRPRSGSAAARARSHLNDSVALSGCDGGAQGQGAAGDHDVARGSRGRFKVCCSRHLCPALDTCRASRSTQPRVATSLRALRTIFEDPELSQKFSFLQSVRLSRFPYPCSLSRARSRPWPASLLACLVTFAAWRLRPAPGKRRRRWWWPSARRCARWRRATRSGRCRV